MAVKIQIRRGTAAQWTAANPVLMIGELGCETDTGQWKTGDGSTAWNSLGYSVGYPDHEWDGTSIRFKNPDGSWGSYTDLQGETGSITSPLTNNIDFDGYKAISPLLQAYGEQTSSQTHSASGGLTLDLDDGNVHVVTVQDDVTSVAISNLVSSAVNSLTLRIIADGDYSYTWLDPTVVINASTGVDASDTDNSFNSSAAFADVLQVGDKIEVSGFTETDNNGVFRVISATTSKIIVDATLVTESAGDTVDIDRHNLIVAGSDDAPTAPAAYVPKDFVLWTYDGARWMISEVGEF